MIPCVTSDFLHKYFLRSLLPVVLRGRDIVNGTWSGNKRVCISFDCDTEADMIRVPSLLRTLKETGISCSFALVGRLALDYPHVVEEIAKDGYEIVNHTLSHPESFSSLNVDDIRREIEPFQDLMMREFNYRPKGFRAPHLLRRYNKILFDVLKKNELYDSSYVGLGASTIDGLVELPITACPEHPQVCFDYWHHFQLPVIRSSFRKFLDLWEKLLDEEAFVNVFLDPYLASDALLKEMIKLVPDSFKFSQLGDIASYVSCIHERRLIGGDPNDESDAHPSFSRP